METQRRAQPGVLVLALLAGGTCLWLLGRPPENASITLARAREQVRAARLVAEPERFALVSRRVGEFDFAFNLDYRDAATFAARRHLKPRGPLAAEFGPGPLAPVGRQELRLVWFLPDSIAAPGGPPSPVRVARIPGGPALAVDFQGGYGGRLTTAAWQALLEDARARGLRPVGLLRREYYDNPLFVPAFLLRSRLVLPLASPDSTER